MELKIDLLDRGKGSLFRIILGVLFFLISCIWILCIKIIDKENIRAFDWLYSGTFALGGIIHIVGGLSGRFFGKAYILINSELISFKQGIYKKEKTVYWENIKSIDYKPNKFRIEKTDDTTVIINLYEIGYSSKNEIKDMIGCIAREKNIESNIRSEHEK